MDVENALRIARLALCMNYRIVYSEKAKQYVDVGLTRQDKEAAEAYNVLADLSRRFRAPRVSQVSL
jgi:hypothetical protein